MLWPEQFPPILRKSWKQSSENIFIFLIEFHIEHVIRIIPLCTILPVFVRTGRGRVLDILT